MKLTIENAGVRVSGDGGDLFITHEDEVAWKLVMLVSGECEVQNKQDIARRFGFSKQRYYQLRAAFQRDGTAALSSSKRGPKTNYRRGGETTRQIIRHRFLDPDASAEVIGQKLRQRGFSISDRSVYRVIEEYGLQKKGFTDAGPKQ